MARSSERSGASKSRGISWSTKKHVHTGGWRIDRGPDGMNAEIV